MDIGCRLVAHLLTQAQSFMVDPQVAELSTSEAVLTGIGVLVGGWFAYDILCKTLAKTPFC